MDISQSHFMKFYKKNLLTCKLRRLRWKNPKISVIAQTGQTDGQNCHGYRLERCSTSTIALHCSIYDVTVQFTVESCIAQP